MENNNNKSKKTIKTILKVIGILLLFFVIYWCCMFVINVRKQTIDKPIIYIYPEEETELSVELGYKENIVVSYPEYIDGWKVIAKPSGDLIDLNSGKKLYSLYYESNNKKDFKVEKEGFVVKGEDTSKFLEDKLKLLGLNDRETEEFIIYWLPRLQNNKYNYIRFATLEEICENMPLNFSKEPDTLIRVLMTYKELNKKIEVKEQNIVTPERVGYTVVEWGGTEIK